MKSTNTYNILINYNVKETKKGDWLKKQKSWLDTDFDIKYLLQEEND